jgi:glucose/arabinose dehydrogenase
VSDFNNQQLKFKQFFKSKTCNINNYGGRIASANFGNEDGILFSTGATGDDERHLAQDKNSHLGKILFIPFNSNFNDYEIISIGHRNPQGLYSDGSLILSTEHGPYGGDEINKIKKGENYGWPISSYGEKYGFLENKEHKFNYKKSHLKNGFQEPVFSFVPSIGISEIIKIPDGFSKYWKNNFFISSLNGVSLYRVEFDSEYKKIKYKEKIIISERIRDIKYSKKK